MASDAATLQAKVDQLEADMDRLKAFVNDLTGTLDVAIEGGTIPSLMKVVKQILATVPIRGYATAAALLADLTPGDKTAAYALDTKLDYVKSGASGTGSWTAGSNSVIANLVADVAEALGVTQPLALATTVLTPGNFLSPLNGFDFGGLSMRKSTSHPVYEWAFVTQSNKVFFALRKDGWFEFLGFRFDLSGNLDYPIGLFDKDMNFLAGIGVEGPVGPLNSQQVGQVQDLIDEAVEEAQDSSRTPVYLDAGVIKEVEAAGTTTYATAPAGFSYVRAVVRADGRVQAIINRPLLGAEVAVAVSKRLGISFPSDPKLTAIIPLIGQSWANGGDAEPVSDGLTVNPWPDNLLMAGSTVPMDVRLNLPGDGGSEPALDPATITRFQPLLSMTGIGWATNGVTTAEGAGPALMETITGEFGFRPNVIFVVVASGGTAYSGLKKGTTTYANLIAALNKFNTLLALQGQRGYVPFYICEHGQADGGVPIATYKANLFEWHTDLNADVKPIFGQTADAPFVLGQTAEFTGGNYLSALAMVEAMKERPEDFVVAYPHYLLKSFYNPDWTHVNAQGLVKAGHDYLMPMGLQQAFGVGGRPLWVDQEGSTWNGTTYSLAFHNPGTQIAVDTQFTDPGDWGFVFADSSGALPVLTKTLASGNTKIDFTFTRATNGVVTMRYACNGFGDPKIEVDQPRGCIRSNAFVPNTSAYHWLLLGQTTFSS